MITDVTYSPLGSAGLQFPSTRSEQPSQDSVPSEGEIDTVELSSEAEELFETTETNPPPEATTAVYDGPGGFPLPPPDPPGT